jgi:hypothetical protein
MFRYCVIWLALTFSTIPLLAGDLKSSKSDEPAASEKRPPTPELAVFQLFEGPWQLVETHFNERGEVTATVKGTEENHWTLDQRVLQRTYMSSTASGVFRALGFVTFNGVEKRYQGVWFDNVSNGGPAQVKGDWEAATKSFQSVVESTGADGKPIRHRIVERFIDADTRVATTYLLNGQEVTKKLEVRYQRSSPCPSSIRVLFDE